MDFASDVSIGNRIRAIKDASVVGITQGVTLTVTQVISSINEPFVIGLEAVVDTDFGDGSIHCIPTYLCEYFEVLPDMRDANKLRLERLVGLCKYKDWRILLRYDGDRPYVQIKFMDTDNFGTEEEEQSCRKWMLSYHMCDSEVVRTVKKAIDSAVQHEADENFKYNGRSIYNPHRSVDTLWDAAAAPGSIDIRS